MLPFMVDRRPEPCIEPLDGGKDTPTTGAFNGLMSDLVLTFDAATGAYGASSSLAAAPCCMPAYPTVRRAPKHFALVRQDPWMHQPVSDGCRGSLDTAPSREQFDNLSTSRFIARLLRVSISLHIISPCPFRNKYAVNCTVRVLSPHSASIFYIILRSYF